MQRLLSLCQNSQECVVLHTVGFLSCVFYGVYSLLSPSHACMPSERHLFSFMQIFVRHHQANSTQFSQFIVAKGTKKITFNRMIARGLVHLCDLHLNAKIFRRCKAPLSLNCGMAKETKDTKKTVQTTYNPTPRFCTHIYFRSMLPHTRTLTYSHTNK